MPTEQIGEYEIEYTGMPLTGSEDWAAYVTIYGPSPNPMHRSPLVPTQRVALESVFASEEEAAAEAHKIALEMLAK